MNIGDKYWCIEPDNETFNYNDDPLPARPWRGVVTEVHLLPPPCVILNRFSKETGEPDFDTNATAIVSNDRLFTSEREAFEAFVDRVQAYFAHKRSQLNNDECTELEYINKKRMEFLNVG
jgi:hypothetical protein